MHGAAGAGICSRGVSARDEAHLATAFLYVALNPVRARLIAKAADWRWASTAAHLAALDDGLVDPRPLRELMPDFAERLAAAEANGAGEMRAFQAFRLIRGVMRGPVAATWMGYGWTNGGSPLHVSALSLILSLSASRGERRLRRRCCRSFTAEGIEDVGAERDLALPFPTTEATGAQGVPEPCLGAGPRPPLPRARRAKRGRG